MVKASSVLDSGTVIGLVRHLNKINLYIVRVTQKDSIDYCRGATVIGEQVSEEQLSSQSNCLWEASVRKARVEGTSFPESYQSYKVYQLQSLSIKLIQTLVNFRKKHPQLVVLEKSYVSNLVGVLYSF
jgi:hypothetical protein